MTWDIEQFAIDVAAAGFLALLYNLVPLCILIALQVTQGLPPWAWGAMGGWFIGEIGYHRRELYKSLERPTISPR